MTYDTMDQAALAGLKMAVDNSTNDRFEWGGIIKKEGGKFTVLGPVTSKSKGMVSGADMMALANNEMSDVVATYHTHVEGYPNIFTDYYSMSDAVSGLLTHTVTYMATTDGREAYKLIPWESDPIQLTYEGNPYPSFKGDLIGRL